MEPRRRRAQTLDRQLDLFEPSPSSARGATPGWSALPNQTQRTLTGLVTRLLIAHAGGETPDLRSSADDL